MGSDPFKEAARWWVRLGRGPLSTAEADAFQRWLGAKPENSQAWADSETAWALAGEAAFIPAPAPVEVSDTRPRRAARRLGWRWSVAGASFAAVAGGLAVWVAPQMGPTAQAYETRVGELRAVPLADGSVVTLDADSALTVKLGRNGRDVSLARGRAHFEVAHAASRPFRVTAGGALVTATGTSFDVNRTAGEVDVVLLRGGVIVRAGDEAVRLRPGEHVSAGSEGRLRPEPVDPAAAAGWRQGRLSFHDEPLADIAQEMNRYGGARLVIADPRLAGARFSGVFRAGDTAALAEALQAAGVVGRISRRDGEIVIGAPDVR